MITGTLYENYEKICQKGFDLCKHIKQYPNPKEIVAFFDIDGTLIDNSTNTLIPCVYQLYNYVKDIGITIAIITARPGDTQNFFRTIQQLEHLGINNYDYLFVRPPYMLDLHKYKMFARLYVVDQGYKPIFSIGDQTFDIGHFGGESLLLTNPL